MALGWPWKLDHRIFRVPFCILNHAKGSPKPFSGDSDGCLGDLGAQPLHFLTNVGAIFHEQALKKQCINEMYSELEKP